MAEITEKPTDLPSTNALDDVEEPREPAPPAYLQITGTSPYAVTDPPERKEELLMVMRLRCNGKAEKDMADNKVKHLRSMSITKMWPLGEDEPPDPEPEPEPEPEAEEPGLLDHNGAVDPDAAGIEGATGTVIDFPAQPGDEVDAEVVDDDVPDEAWPGDVDFSDKADD